MGFANAVARAFAYARACACAIAHAATTDDCLTVVGGK